MTRLCESKIVLERRGRRWRKRRRKREGKGEEGREEKREGVGRITSHRILKALRSCPIQFLVLGNEKLKPPDRKKLSFFPSQRVTEPRSPPSPWDTQGTPSASQVPGEG